MIHEYADLDEIRLAHDWTWDQLAADMARAGVTLSPRTLHYVCKRLPPDGHAHDRTLYKIRAYLKHVRTNPRAAADLRNARRRRQRAAAADSREAQP